MKTMFSRKLFPAGAVACSLLLIAAAPISHLYQARTLFVTMPAGIAPGDSLVKTTHHFDASGLCSCLYCLPADEIKKAPRITLHRTAVAFIHDYIDKNSFYLEKARPKSDVFFNIIDTIFTQQGLPVELKYLAVVESQLNSKIVSKAGAAGMWQLMPVAARKFGLKVGGGQDERTHVYKSTVAASRYLIYLHKVFDDWLLCVAAYNSGVGTVLSAIKKAGSRDFWALESFLPKETRMHVRKFIAVHYYYEGHGSFTTMTKKETTAHINAVAAFMKESETKKTDSTIAGL
jgi:membrane-bound lytic murein transglycosylase D